MNTPKNIETIIREGEKKLTVQPSSRAWHKLERRLDSRQKARKNNVVTMRKWLAVAATLIILVVSFFVISNENPEPQYKYAPTFVEEINGNQSCNPFCLNIEARKTLPAFYALPGKDEQS